MSPAGGRPARPKWHYVYFLLAAFDLFTVCAGVYLNHRIMDIYTRSVAVNQVWAERVAAYSQLGELAAAVNAPGNDVFDSHDVAAEAARMRAALAPFERRLATHREDLAAALAPAVAAPLLAQLDAIAAAMREMIAEAERIFAHFRVGEQVLAGERMATMDHRYARVNSALAQLRASVGEIQKRNFDRQTAAAAELQKYEALIGFFILLMVGGATFYGQRMARQMQADAAEKLAHLEVVSLAEARTRAILDTAADGIIAFAADGRLETFNQAAERLFGYAADEAIGRDVRELVPALATVLADRGAAPIIRLSGDEASGRRRDGSVFPLELAVSAVGVGAKTVFTGIVRDLSERRQAEEARRLAAAAEAANRAKSQFLANMSHEIRTPMNGVLGMTEMLLASSLTPAQRRFAETAQRSGEALLAIIDDILDFSKVEAGKIELEAIDFNPHVLVAEVAALLARTAEKKGLELVCRVAAEVPEALRGDPLRLRQILTNLVGNAIKFTERGKVGIEVCRLAADGPARLRFAVRDTGPGISESVRARLFQPFSQADSSTTRRYGGTGLGLAISRQLVELMGGEIGVASVPGGGAEFWFTLSLVAAPSPIGGELSGSREALAEEGLSGLRVLLAEDTPVNQDVARAMLEALDCRVRAVGDGRAALAALAAEAFDLVLMDCQMPEMDGYQATAEIRRRGLRRPGAAERLPVIALTANAMPADRELCLAAGMDDYLAKPLRLQALRAMLERWRGVGVATPTPPAAVVAPATLDARALDDIRSLQRPGAPNLLARIIGLYFETAPRQLAELGAAARAADAAALARLAHQLKASSANLGALALAARCAELELAARAGDSRTALAQVAAIEQEYAAVRAALAAAQLGEQQ